MFIYHHSCMADMKMETAQLSVWLCSLDGRAIQLTNQFYNGSP